MIEVETTAGIIAAEMRRVLREKGLPDPGVAAVGRALIGLAETGTPRTVQIGTTLMVLPARRGG